MMRAAMRLQVRSRGPARESADVLREHYLSHCFRSKRLRLIAKILRNE